MKKYEIFTIAFLSIATIALTTSTIILSLGLQDNNEKNPPVNKEYTFSGEGEERETIGKINAVGNKTIDDDYELILASDYEESIIMTMSIVDGGDATYINGLSLSKDITYKMEFDMTCQIYKGRDEYWYGTFTKLTFKANNVNQERFPTEENDFKDSYYYEWQSEIGYIALSFEDSGNNYYSYLLPIPQMFCDE